VLTIQPAINCIVSAAAQESDVPLLLNHIVEHIKLRKYNGLIGHYAGPMVVSSVSGGFSGK